MSETNHVPPPLIALSGWILPGAGYWLIGQRARGVTVGITILAIFIFGILVSGIRVVEAPNMHSSTSTFQEVLSKPWFIGQILTGPTCIVAAWISDDLAQSPRYKNIESKARLAEIGTLYTAVAGMLNLLTIVDAGYRAAGGR